MTPASLAALPQTLLSRIEDAGLNASAPPQQRWLDGWLLRFSPGKAKRARCINAVAEGQLSLDEKLALAQRAYRDAGLPLFVRITPFSRPASLDARLAGLGLVSIDDTRVMVCDELSPIATPTLPPGVSCLPLPHSAFAQTVGRLRGSPLAQRQAHAQRLDNSPVPFLGFALKRDDDAAVLACGQFALEDELVGLYDVFTAEAARGQGLARLLCQHLLADARARGSRVAYLQVEGDNAAARSVYLRLGFNDAYAYHYRCAAADAV